ncbi:MAG: hypothetical protein EBR82_47930 [Caulobacteraceae bacterium]|nr:hypothetical protein [Caulobacteraceae bacterium]
MVARLRKIVFDHTEGAPYPYVCSAWREVGGMNVGDKFTQEVGDVLIEALREDGIEIVVEELQPKGDR